MYISSILGEKEMGAIYRISNLKSKLNLVLHNPFGVTEHCKTGTSLFLSYGLLMGYFGVILCGIIYTSIIMRLVYAFRLVPSLLSKIGIASIIGTIIQSLLFIGYGWLSASGIIISLMVYVRSENLIAHYSKEAES